METVDYEKKIDCLEVGIQRILKKLEFVNDSYVNGQIQVEAMVKELDNIVKDITNVEESVFYLDGKKDP